MTRGPATSVAARERITAASLGHDAAAVKMVAGRCRPGRSPLRWSPLGAIAQLVERFHGMEEVRGSIPLSSTAFGLWSMIDAPCRRAPRSDSLESGST